MIYAVAASSDAADFQSDEGGSQPTLLLHLLPDEDFTQPRWTIREVGSETARQWYGRHHYLGDSATAARAWGVFAPDLAAVVSIGLPNNQFGVASRLGLQEFKGNLELSRVAVHPAFPAERSRVIRRVLAVAVPDDEWVFAYADPKVGHHGGIYQALGAVYCGVSPQYTGWVDRNGVLLHPRTAVSVYGSQAGSQMRARGYQAVPAAFGGLHTYILPLRRADAIRAVLAPHALPYPKHGAT